MRELLTGIVGLSSLMSVPGGVLWALSPLGVYLSELRFDTPNVFWKLFPSAPLLLLIGLVGLNIMTSSSSGGLKKAGYLMALFGLILIIVSAVGRFWLGIDDIYIMTAPAYRSLRLGLFIMAAGAILFGVGIGIGGTLPVSGVLPFTIGALCGLISVSRDLGDFGAVLWILFGVGWAWLGLALLLERTRHFRRSIRREPTRPSQ